MMNKQQNELPFAPKLITTTVQSNDLQKIFNLLDQFLTQQNYQLCRQLLVEIMLQEDIQDVFASKDDLFLRDVLSGDGWIGYSHLSFAQIIQEFDNRELFTNYFDDYLDVNSKSLFLDRLYTLAKHTSSDNSSIFSILTIVTQGVIEKVFLFEDKLEAEKLLNRISSDYHPEEDDLRIFQVSFNHTHR